MFGWKVQLDLYWRIVSSNTSMSWQIIIETVENLSPQNDSFSHRLTLESLKTLHYSIIFLLRENWLKSTKTISVTQGVFFQFLYSLWMQRNRDNDFGHSQPYGIHTLTWDLSSFFALYSTECYTNCVATNTKCYTYCVATKKYSTAHSQ